jgi:hypothetical protein
VNTEKLGNSNRNNFLVKQLRGAALQEVKIPSAQVISEPKLAFDVDHARTNIQTADFDRDSGVARYPGQNIEHIGNGSGGVRK